MDAETSRWAWGLVAVVGAALIGVIYSQLTREDSRLAKNIHDLRNFVNRMLQLVESRLDKLERDKQDKRK